MCGICGIWGLEEDAARRDARVAAMEESLRHRGPDDRGAFSDGQIALGFRRLAVIDLETGGQPIRSDEDGSVIVLNGEIYNFRELRSEIASRHRFRTRGDVEVVLHLFAQGGVEALRRLNGMFALAIWQPQRRTLTLARDRFGIKPLFLWRDPSGAVAFASEVRALLASGLAGTPDLDLRELRHFLYQRYVSPDGSVLRGIRALPPGGVLQLGPDGERRHRLWESPAAPRPMAAHEAEARLEERLEQAVRRQMIADVPLGVFLSGGLDSSTLTALARREGGGPLRTFSVGFRGAGAVDERPAARRVAAHLGTEHHEMTVEAEQVAGDLDRILSDLDGPLADPTCVPTWYLSRHARSRVTVALSGEGADELFGGYRRQRYDALLDRIGAPGRALLPAVMRLAGRRASTRLRARLSMPPGLARQLDWSVLFRRDTLAALAEAGLPGEEEVLELHAALAREFGPRAAADPLNARLEIDRRLFLPGDLLPKVDRMSMAHSLEVRVPYLDNDVVELLTRLPGRHKGGWLSGKRVLRRVAARLLPKSSAGRRKQGFDVPIGAWLRGPLRAALTDHLAEETLRRRGLFRPAAVTEMVRAHLDGRADHGEPLWALLVLEGWTRQVLDRAAPVEPIAGGAAGR